MDPREEFELTGVAALADQRVDGRRVAGVMGCVGLVLAVALGGLSEHLLASPNLESDAGRLLRDLGPDGPAPGTRPGHLAVVLFDGMRADEASSLESWRSLRERSTTGTVLVGLPSLSRPFYHHLFTGVPASASGVRTNRYSLHARHDSVMDRVRSAGGRVFIAADGLDWMARMHGRPEDDLDVADGALGPRLDATLDRFRSAPAPALLVVHFLDLDATAHREGIHGRDHRRALSEADALLGRLDRALPGATILATSDHGHRENGGHGGDETDVVRTPLLVRRPVRPGEPGAGHSPRAFAASARALEAPVDASRLAATIAMAVGVRRPRSAVGGAEARLFGEEVATDPWPERARDVVRAGARRAEAELWGRRRFTLLFALLFAVMTLGPIKRAFGFDRSVLVAGLVPLLVVLGHLALDRPLTLSAIDVRWVHILRVVALGGCAALLALGVGRLVSRRGDGPTRTRRAAAALGWGAANGAFFAASWVGFALGPWSLGPRTFYLPILACGAGAAAVAVASLVLLFSFLTTRGAQTGEGTPSG